MNGNDVLGMTALQKTLEYPYGKMGISNVFEIKEKWQLEEMRNAGLIMEAKSARDFEEKIFENEQKPLVISSFALNDTLLEKILRRNTTARPVFIHKLV